MSEQQAPGQQIESFWTEVGRSYDIEDRAYFEREAVPMGFASPLAMAVHHMWKRDVKDRKGLTICEAARGESSAAGVEPTPSRGCKFDTDGDGNCPVHPAGCPVEPTPEPPRCGASRLPMEMHAAIATLPEGGLKQMVTEWRDTLMRLEPAPPPPAPCRWRADFSGPVTIYRPSCMNPVITDLVPVGFEFCCYCGHPIEVTR